MKAPNSHWGRRFRSSSPTKLPLIALTVATLVVGLIGLGQIWDPLGPTTVRSNPYLTVWIDAVEQESTELLMTQDVTALEDGTVSEHIQVLARVGEEWATIRHLQVGWSGLETAWNCYPYNTANPPARVSLEAGGQFDFGMSSTWSPGDVRAMQESFNPLDRQFRWGSDEQLPISTARKVMFPADERQRVIGLECMRRGTAYSLSDARVMIQPARLGVDVKSLPADATLTTSYEKTALRVPREWTRTSGLIDELQEPETLDPYVRTSGSTSAFGLMGADFVFRDPTRQRWIDVTFATLTLLASVLIGVVIQVQSDRRAQNTSARDATGEVSPPTNVGEPSGASLSCLGARALRLVGALLVWTALVLVLGAKRSPEGGVASRKRTAERRSAGS